MKNLLFLLASLLIFLSCEKDSVSPAPPADGPIADFTAEPTAGSSTTIQFTDRSTTGENPIISWLWDFGDDSTSTEQNPIHTYDIAATYTVKLTVSDGNLNDSHARTEIFFKPLGNMRFSGRLADVWGYVDNSTGKEYALVGFLIGGGISIVDVSNPEAPLVTSELTTVPGFDIKVWQHYVYSVTGSGTGIGSVVDISNPANPQIAGSFPSHHNIFINDSGYMFGEAGSHPLVIYDLNPDPAAPRVIWSGGTEGHDATVIGNRLYDFHGQTGTNIYDISNITAPQLIGIIKDPAISFHHSGWTSQDGNYLFICDELSNHPQADITVWDLHQVDNPDKVGRFADSSATVHNLYVKDNYAYVAYYTSGFRIFDVSTPQNIKVVAHFDTSDKSGQGFNGAFGVYPFAPSGNIYVTDGENGLFIFNFEGEK
jgi:choice-of-anchor B domain-containing protein